MCSLEKPWVVFRIELTGRKQFPYRILGVNLNHPVTSPDFVFSWEVPDLECDQYDLSNVSK